MISRISIENFIIIEKLDIVFDSGFTSITGETGTGKSIILDAINFCFGRFGSKNIQKFPNSPSVVEIEFTFAKSQDTLKIKRALNPSGKSSYFINDEQALNKDIKVLFKQLIDITAQHDTILSEEYQYNIFNDILISSNDEARRNLDLISELYTKLKDLEQDTKLSDAQLEEEKRYKAYNSQIISELDGLGIKENEETNLLLKRTNIAKLVSNNNLIKSSLASLQACFGNPLYQAIKNLERINNGSINGITKRLERIDIESSDIISELQNIVSDIDSTESELSEIDERLSLIRTIARKYNTPANTLFEFLEESKGKINLIESITAKLNNLREEISRTIEQYNDIAERLSKARGAIAGELSREVLENLKELLLSNADFKIEIEANKLNRKSDGFDDVRFMASFNKEKALFPLSQIASGGEAARLNFALKLAIAERASCNVMIFDEIDIGIGGSAAYAMGKLMKKFAHDSNLQIISITHSPQIAAKADHHLLVQKAAHDQNTNVTISKLNDAQRINEIARMISGDVINKEATLAARQLIQD